MGFFNTVQVIFKPKWGEQQGGMDTAVTTETVGGRRGSRGAAGVKMQQRIPISYNETAVTATKVGAGAFDR